MDPGLPDLVWRVLGELGVAKQTGMGLAPLDYADMQAYEALTGRRIGRAAPVLRKISAAYVAGHSRPKDAPPPWYSSADALAAFVERARRG